MKTAMYLRKSRAEEISDSIDETLRKHKEALLDFAQKNSLTVSHIYEEVISGESLYARPQMLQLLCDVSNSRYNAVLCMDIDRLGRGTMSEQGIILETFKQAHTKIITPRKTYDLNNELDEEYTEFETFIARRELKIIKRRMQRGVRKSIEEGSYLANAPYGYVNTTQNKHPTLAVNEDEAYFVRMIFDMYVHQGKGCQTIADTLNALGAKPHRSSAFCRNSVRHILKNPAFIGKIVWNRKRRTKNAAAKEKSITMCNPPEEWIVVDGIHPAIIDEDLFYSAQKILADKYHPPYYKGTVENPLAGIVYCRICGMPMQRRPFQDAAAGLLCTTKGCVKSSRLDLVENALLDCIQKQLATIKIVQQKQNDGTRQADWLKAIKALENERTTILQQKGRLQDLLEQQIYDPATYQQRSSLLESKLKNITQTYEAILNEPNTVYSTKQETGLQKIKSALEAYRFANAQEKNMILKSIIKSASYYKAKDWKPNQFELMVTLRNLDLQHAQSFSPHESYTR